MNLDRWHRSNAGLSSGATRAVALAASMLFANAARAAAQELEWTQSPHNGLWYAELASPSSWSGAEALARQLGGHLATVNSAAESAWLDAQFLSVLAPYRQHWIGLFQDTSDPAYAEPAGGWKWSSGAPLTFARWAALQPDDLGGAQKFGRSAGPQAVASDEWLDDDDLGSANFGGADDLYVAPGALQIFNTASSVLTLSQIVYVPNTDTVAQVIPVSQRTFVGGVLDIADLVVAPGAVLKIEGPNPLVVLARGRVLIQGRLLVDGTSSAGVVTLNTTSIPEPGAPGQAGGGRGGTGSPLTGASSSSGEAGWSALNFAQTGGQGGEAGWSSSTNKNARRGAGGGGGSLGANVAAPVGSSGAFQQARVGFDAEPGFDNLSASNGALSGPGSARGGAVGSRPFRDASAANDFYGIALDAAGNQVVGELVRPWAGAGGGGGGDASFAPAGSYPPPFLPTGDEKGAGGGGGGGSCQILALERIVFGVDGLISARGGNGGGGENTIFLDRVGGSSGAGSGGHVILQSAVHIDLRAKIGVALSNPLDNRWAIDTRGGQGGAGANDLGGARLTSNGSAETTPNLDACPPGYPQSGANACAGHVDGTGGDGGPGIVQLHTPLGVVGTDPASADILVASAVALDQLCAPAPLFSSSNPQQSGRLVTSFGSGIGLVELASSDCDGNGKPDRYEIQLEPTLDLDRDGLLDACDATVTYCVGGPSMEGCELLARSSGTPSASAASGFDLLVDHAPGQRAGRWFFGLGAQFLPYSNNALCVSSPLQRLGLTQSGGSAGQCDGQLVLDWNAWRAAHPTGLGSPYSAGQTLYAQGWIRDPAHPTKVALSSAHRFTLAP